MINFLNDIRVLECSLLINGCSLGNFFGDDPMEGLSPLQEAAMWRYLMDARRCTPYVSRMSTTGTFRDCSGSDHAPHRRNYR